MATLLYVVLLYYYYYVYYLLLRSTILTIISVVAVITITTSITSITRPWACLPIGMHFHYFSKSYGGELEVEMGTLGENKKRKPDNKALFSKRKPDKTSFFYPFLTIFPKTI